MQIVWILIITQLRYDFHITYRMTYRFFIQRLQFAQREIILCFFSLIGIQAISWANVICDI